MNSTGISHARTLRLIGFVLLLSVVFVPRCMQGQATVSTGSILGTVSDPTGAVVANAAILITNTATGRLLNTVSSPTGTYSLGALIPGDYTVKIDAKGFRPMQLTLTVQVGVTTSGNVTVTVGSELQVVQAVASSVMVNTEQATIQGVLTTQQIEQLPINGRNFLDLAQLEPGIQIQDAGTFDPTKAGFSAISIGGRTGRMTRIALDGVDATDENVGTTMINIPESAIQEFQVSQAALDLSTELTSSGAVNVVTRSGSNKFHGDAFFAGRWHNTAARVAPTDLFFRREQFGGRFGGPIIKDKLFFFLDWERSRQDLNAPVVLTAPFTALSGTFNAPFREDALLGRADWQIKPSVHAFYRFLYNKNSNVIAFIPNSFQPFMNKNQTPIHVFGLDVSKGTWTHTFRFGDTHYRNGLTDAVAGTNIVNPAPPISLTIGSFDRCFIPGADVFCSGISALAPQITRQWNLQFKYDGSKFYHSHVIRFGVGYDRVKGLEFAGGVNSAPVVNSTFTATTRAFASAGPFPGGDTNPLNYPAQEILLGNGLGFFTEIPAFGFIAGGLPVDNRFSWYVGDTWKFRPNITINYGVRYVRDTGRTDSDMAPIPCSQLSSLLAASLLTPCTGNIIDLFGPGLGNRVHQPDANFAPQLGIVWDPWKNGKTVIRAAAGVFYDNSVWNTLIFDRGSRLPTGFFRVRAKPCPSGSLILPTGSVIDTSALCGQPIGSIISQAVALQQDYQTATAAVAPETNGLFIGNTLADGQNSTGRDLLDPNYRSVHSLQFNGGFQREIRPGTVVSADYIRNVGLRYLMAIDTNHVGDSRFLNPQAALNAINTTNTTFLCPSGIGGIDCAIGNGATMVNYASNGLDTGTSFLGGLPAALQGLTPDTGAAFPGINPYLGENQMLSPIGRSVYNALQVRLRHDAQQPLRGVQNLSLQVSYTLSRFKSQFSDPDFEFGATSSLVNFRNPGSYFGPNGLDRTHQLAFSGVGTLPGSFRVSLIGHFGSALPQTLSLPTAGQPGEIFRTDVTGDGTTGDILPRTNIGSFGRDVKVGDLNRVIGTYNSTAAGQLTPAGQALVNAGLFTKQQMINLGAITPTVASAPAGEVGLDAYKTIDVSISWSKKIGESFTIEPSVGIFNLFNLVNFDSPNNPLTGVLTGEVGSVNGTTSANRANRYGLGSGVFAGGAPRVFEWGMRVTF